MNILNKLMTIAEAGEKWGKDVSTLRKNFASGQQFKIGEDIRKSGNTWLVTVNAMERVYGSLDKECEMKLVTKCVKKGREFYVFEEKGEYYITFNKDLFLDSVKHGNAVIAKFKQQVTRVIGDVIFVSSINFPLYLDELESEEIRQALKEKFKEDNADKEVVQFVNMSVKCGNGYNICRDIYKILSYNKIKNDSNRVISILKIINLMGYEEMYLEVMYRSCEDYSLEYTLITKEMEIACNNDLVKEYLKHKF